jgi:CheY-like chemotaxis protein
MKPVPRPRILVVDDDATMRRIFERVLLRDFEVTQAAGGAEALAVLRSISFDAVVTDLEMPEVGGDAVVDWIEANQPQLARRVIVITGGAKLATRVEWLQRRDPSQVLRKPCSAEALLAALRARLPGGMS